MAEEKNTTHIEGAEDAREACVLVYEVGYHLIPTLEDIAIEAAGSRIRSIIEKAGGTFIAEGTTQRISLAQPMAVWNNGRWIKYSQSHFGWIKYELMPSSLALLEEHLKKDAEVLRSIIFKTVREDTRANVRQFVLKEVKRTDTIKSTPRRTASEVTSEVSEEKIDEAIAELVAD